MWKARSIAAPQSYDAGDFLIRAYRPGDGAALNRAMKESYDHLITFLPWASLEETVEDSEALCRRFAGRYLLNEDYVLGIWRGNEVIGGTGFHLRVGGPETRAAEVGMWIHAAHAGKGLGTAALQAMLRWGFNEWSWRRLVWKCDVQNLASAQVARKCGLRLEGTFKQDFLLPTGNFRDTHQFAILQEEWWLSNSHSGPS
jgi:RimJ/RimL family protein N-acetyltransferase